ncbi:unknown [Bacteroides sp. CAG:144]|nr:unknown [Bacteroides sp. CAG:144]
MAVINVSTSGVVTYIGKRRATKNTPATTIVAAWIRADTGVGPSIASGNQICNGNIADLPAPPINTNIIAQEATEIPRNVFPAVVPTSETSPLVNVAKSKVLV